MTKAPPPVVWRPDDSDNLTPYVWDPTQQQEIAATWMPQPGSQAAFLSCPIYEALYEGTRGPGKTDALLMDYAQHVGPDQRTQRQRDPSHPQYLKQTAGWGEEWKGILFRQSFPQLQDVIAKSKKWFPRLWPDAKYNESKSIWTWATGETLRFSFIEKADDYWNFHGHAYPWIGYEELTTWPDDTCYTVMMSCSRSSVKGIPRKYRATTNPYGPGHNWVKLRFGLPVPTNSIIGKIIKSVDQPDRVAIHGKLAENRILLHADPDYISRIRSAARNPSELAAWIDGSWDITAGGMFDDLWDAAYHVVPSLPLAAIPATWRVDRSYDHGQSKPFSVGWWAESNGEPLHWNGRNYGHVKGDLFRIFEWYGCTAKPNNGVRMSAAAIADGIIAREEDWGLLGHVKKGPADSSIFDDFEPGKSIAGDMRMRGVDWDRADKRPGSRKQGWEQLRKMLRGAMPNEDGSRESPGLFICQRCTQTLRTFPVLPRSDKDLDDANTDAEDHIADEIRYRSRHKRVIVGRTRSK